MRVWQVGMQVVGAFPPLPKKHYLEVCSMKKVQQGFTLIELMIVVAIIGILAAIALPQYQTYVAKSQVSRVMGEAGAIKTVVETCLLEGRTTPVNNSAAPAATECVIGFAGSSLMVGAIMKPADAAAGIGGLDVVIAAAESTLIATFGNSASGALTTTTLTWTRDANGSWTCGTTVDAKYAPSGCPVTAADGGGGGE